MPWQIDAAHSRVGFSVKHMMVSTVKGHFAAFSGTLNIDEANPANSWVEVEVDAASVDTRDSNRDNHLRTPDFFDAQQYPKITFKSTKVEHVDGNDYNIFGDLTLHGVTKPIVLKAEYSGTITDPYGFNRAGFEAQVKISRKDFGLTTNAVLETGGAIVGDEVKIEIDLEVFTKVEAVAK